SQRLGVVSSGVLVQVNAAAPAVLTMDIEGQQYPMLFHAVDGTLVTPIYPADPNELLVMYAAGLGAVTPNVAAGEFASNDPLSSTPQSVDVTIGGRAQDVAWAGLAPSLIGIYQINFVVPVDRLRGDDLPIVINVGGASSGLANAPVAAIE